jgi:hypothetical protein
MAALLEGTAFLPSLQSKAGPTPHVASFFDESHPIQHEWTPPQYTKRRALKETIRIYYDQTTKMVLCEDDEEIGEVSGVGLGWPLMVSGSAPAGTFYIFYRYATEERVRLFVLSAESPKAAAAIVASTSERLLAAARSGSMD